MKDGKTELSGKDKMNSFLKQLQDILLENSVENTSASNNIAQHSKKIEDGTKGGLKASPKKKTKKSNEEDLTDLSNKDLEGKGEEQEDEKEKESEQVETPDESPSTINLADAMSFENLIEVLNQFRAAHSFTDKKVYSQLKLYFEKLNENEKKVLHVFIKGLIQVTMLNVSGKSAYSPNDLMFDINKKGSVSSEKKRSMKKKIDSKKDASSGNAPIKIGESVQNKEKYLNIVYSNK